MKQRKHFGLIGGLGVGATVLYYEEIAAACAKRGLIPRLTIAHAHAPTALALVQAGHIDDMATYSLPRALPFCHSCDHPAHLPNAAAHPS
jgi:aspartate/glutamate racemase